ncbi:MAG: hypothetical protein ACRC8Y_24020 [Chroococcales cyanobacterium]
MTVNSSMSRKSKIGYYVIPVMMGNIALFGVRVLLTSWDQRKGEQNSWCGGGPNVFGGNSDGKAKMDTLQKEVQEESHNKIIITATENDLIYLWEGKYQGRNNYYYALKTGFDYNKNSKPLPREQLIYGYKETTGQVIEVKLESLDPTSLYACAAGVIKQFKQQGIDVPDQSVKDFNEDLHTNSIWMAAQKASKNWQ